MKHLLTFFLLLLRLTAPAQRHVRGRFPRHVKALRMDEALLDTTHTVVAVDGAWQGLQLPQAFTGKDVMMGVTDVGFDFTHPTFRQSHWVGFWVLLSRDTLHSHTPVFTGRDYSAEEMRDLQHSYDALDHTHGTLVLGTAAGGDATYRGMAFEADVLVVNTVLSNNAYMADSL